MPPTSAPHEAAPVATHRQVFETRYRALPQDARAQAAGTVSDPDLSALCYDSASPVIDRILDNPSAGLVHARLIAAHHPNPIGLKALARRVAYAQDPEVRRMLLRNIQTPDTVVRSLFSSRPLTEIFRFSRSHDYPERHRKTALGTVQHRFSTSTPEERADLIFTTEGRVLAALPGLPLDGPTVGALCLRGAFSMQLVENLARWPGTPPKLVAHLLKQPVVSHSASLKQAISRRRGCPST